MNRTARGFQEGRLEQGNDDLRRRRKVTMLVLAFVVALTLFFWLVPLGLDRDFHHRTSRSSASMGFRGLHDLLGKLGQEVQRHRRPYRELPRADESLLLILDPFDHKTLRKHGRARFDHDQWADLHDWVRAGGHALVVLPTWEATESADASEQRRLRPNAARAALEAPPPGDWQTDIPRVNDGSWLNRSWFPLGEDPLLFAFGEGQGSWTVPQEEWKRNRMLFAPFWQRQPLWIHAEQRPGPWMQFFTRPFPVGYELRAELAGEPLLLKRRVGDGAVWVLSSGWPLSNMALAKGHSAWFAYQLLEEASTRFRRRFVFDEFSHGDTDTRGMFGWLEESGALYPLLALGILFLLAVWKGLIRIGAPVSVRLLPRRAKEEFVVGLASLLHSQERRGFVARSLIEESRHRLENGTGLSHSERMHRLGILETMEEAMESTQKVSYSGICKLAEELDALVRKKEASPK